IVLPDILAADGRNGRGPSAAAKSPETDVELMHALIADVAVAGVPEPMPRVFVLVHAVRLPLRGTEEHVPVEAGGNGGVGRVADREAAEVTESARVIDLPNGAFVQQLHGANLVRNRA